MSATNNFLCILLFLYNIIFMSYNEHFRKASIGSLFRTSSIGILFLLLFVMFFYYYHVNKGIKVRNDNMSKSTSVLCLAGIVALVLSLFNEVTNSRFDLVGHTLKYFFIYIIPIVFSYMWANTVDDQNKRRMIDCIFFAGVAYFVFDNITNFTPSAIFSISWNNSYSSAFESDNAHLFLFTLVFYRYVGDKRKSILSLILCMLSFKRLSFILAPLLFFGHKLFFGKKTNRFIIYALAIAMVILPVGLELLAMRYENLAKMLNGLDLNELSSGRLMSIVLLRPYKSQFLGLGSIAYFIEHSTQLTIQKIGYLHCDLLVWIWECGIIPVIIMVFGLSKIMREDSKLFIMIAYLFFMLSTTHFLDMHLYMTSFYMITFYFLFDKSREKELIEDSQNQETVQSECESVPQE